MVERQSSELNVMGSSPVASAINISPRTFYIEKQKPKSRNW